MSQGPKGEHIENRALHYAPSSQMLQAGSRRFLIHLSSVWRDWLHSNSILLRNSQASVSVVASQRPISFVGPTELGW